MLGSGLVAVLAGRDLGGQFPNPLTTATYTTPAADVTVSVLGVVVVLAVLVAVVLLAPPRRLLVAVPLLLVGAGLAALGPTVYRLATRLPDAVPRGLPVLLLDVTVAVVVVAAWVLASRRSLGGLLALLAVLPGVGLAAVAVALLDPAADGLPPVGVMLVGYLEAPRLAAALATSTLLCFVGPAWLGVLADRLVGGPVVRQTVAAPPRQV